MAKDNTTIGGFDTSGDDTLLLDNATYNQIQNKLLQSASELIFNKSAFDMEDAVCGTEGMVLLADYWHRVVDSSDCLRDFLCEDVDMICTKVQDSINETDQSLAASLSCNAMGAGKSMLGAFMGRRSTKQKEEPDDAKGTKDTTVEKIDDEFGDIQILYKFSYEDIQFLKENYLTELKMLQNVQKYSTSDASKIYQQLRVKVDEIGRLLFGIGWNEKDLTPETLDEIKEVLKKYNITTKEEICAFLAECSYETGMGKWYIEKGDEAYFTNNGYGIEYRGGGAIQITHDYGYKAFATYVLLKDHPELNEYGHYVNPAHLGEEYVDEQYNNLINAAKELGIEVSNYQNIVSEGAVYVAENYAWETAGYYWEINNLNDVIDSGTINDVSDIVNSGDTETFPKREEYYNTLCENYDDIF
ncbi:hypothetical protein D6856_03535 [Butyrivibrio sp. XB500-5]|uniref:hypothetical protein n=1 Tax=Butyrivibrio sp. XB500-5 TaxID=2364880 RepID=UPI000EAA1DAE|nr:hypothetical protein [Butyrivibrio sp. XB500-5]RKM63208.1 hypothetical protein D6856_03535 [Butyrivibrio sp. XB500-5]